MKFTCNKKDLVEAISTVQKAVAVKSTKAILEGICIEAKGQVIILQGTDLEVSIETVFITEVFEEGKIVVDSKVFGDIIRKLPNMPITIETLDNNILNISAERSNFNLLFIDSSEFPIFPVLEETRSFEISQALLKNMIKKVIFSVATDDTRPILMGVYFEVLKDSLNLVALDGYRMAICKENIAANDEFSLVVSGKTLREISGLLLENDNAVKISYTENHVLFELNSTKIISRLLQGDFINYKSMIPDYTKLTVTANKNELYEAAERASVMANEATSNLIRIDFENNNANVSSNSKLGKVREDVTVDMNGEPLEIAFNSKYLNDVLKAVDEEEVVLELTSNIRPCIIKPVGNDRYLYLVLPVRIAK